MGSVEILNMARYQQHVTGAGDGSTVYVCTYEAVQVRY